VHGDAHADERTGVIAGALLGLLSLVKPHALALVVAVAVLSAYRGSRDDRVLAILGLALAFCAARIGIGYLLSGNLDFSLTGPAYREAIAIHRLEPAAFAVNALGHAMALLFLAGLPLAAIVVALVRQPWGDAGAGLRDLLLLALCALAALVAMTIWFSYSVHLGSPEGERITRLHGRYYAFALTLTMLAYAGLVNSGRVPSFLHSNVALSIGVVLTAAAYGVLGRFYESSVIDFPELGILSHWPKGLLVPAAAMTACAIAMSQRRRRGMEAHWRAALPLVWWAAIAVSTSMLLLAGPLAGKWFTQGAVDAAMAASPLRELRGRDDGMIVGTHAAAADTYRVMIHVAARAHGRIVAPGTTIPPESVPADVRWLILLPDVDYAGPGETASSGPLRWVKLP
jgi:phosphoglycerol transferase